MNSQNLQCFKGLLICNVTFHAFFRLYIRKKKFVGHIQEYPDYESQGKTLEELRDNLIDIYDDIREGLVPDAKPSQISEVAI